MFGDVTVYCVLTGGTFRAYLSDAFPLHLQGLHLGEVVVVRDHVGDDRLLVRVVHADVCTHDLMYISTASTTAVFRTTLPLCIVLVLLQYQNNTTSVYSTSTTPVTSPHPLRPAAWSYPGVNNSVWYWLITVCSTG